MGSVTGQYLTLSIFGESHGQAVGALIDNYPSGIHIDRLFIDHEMKRRSATGKRLATPRKESDVVEILSGIFKDYSEGTPICGMIRNQSTRSKDYENLKIQPRPGHADYTASIRYKGYQDYRGGGHFSGRLTAPLVFAGALSKLALRQLYPSISIESRIVSIGNVEDPTNADLLSPFVFEDEMFPVLDPHAKEKMEKAIVDAMRKEDSVGGVIETRLTGIPAGLGDPIFDTVESRLASNLFAVPAVKGVEFGTGFEMAKHFGSEMNDAFYVEDEKVQTYTNHNGGINGGITNGMPVLFRTAIKPTASIAREQKTLNLLSGEEETLRIEGRHDPCITLRACPVIEAVSAFVLLDMLLVSQVV